MASLGRVDDEGRKDDEEDESKWVPKLLSTRGSATIK